MSQAEQQQIIHLSQTLGWIALKKWLMNRRTEAVNEVLNAAVDGDGSLAQAAVVRHIDQTIGYVDNMQKRVGGDSDS